MFPKNEKGEFIFSSVDYVDTWKAMECLMSTGRVRTLGVSNFNSSQLQRLIDHASIKPALIQVCFNLL